jgi:hypothetical protein
MLQDGTCVAVDENVNTERPSIVENEETRDSAIPDSPYGADTVKSGD